MFSIFACPANGRTLADSTLSIHLLKDAIQQVDNTGEYTTLDGDQLRLNVPGCEVLAQKYEKLMLKVPVDVEIP